MILGYFATLHSHASLHPHFLWRETLRVSLLRHKKRQIQPERFIYLEYMRELIGGLEKLGAYASLKAKFREGSPYISAAALGKFARILRAGIRSLPESAIKSGGFVIDTLEAALWCFLTTDTYRAAGLKAANLGDDTDTTAAVTGALAGLFYGIEGIPAEWLNTLAAREDILRIAGAMAAALPE